MSPAASKEVISNTGSTRFPGWKEHSIALVVPEKEFIPPAPAHISPKKVPSGGWKMVTRLSASLT